MMKPLSDVDNVYSMLINGESQSEVQSSISSFNSESASFSTAVQKPYTQRVNFNPGQKGNFDSSKRINMVCSPWEILKLLLPESNQCNVTLKVPVSHRRSLPVVEPPSTVQIGCYT
ncbi:hypothetical protein HAX54_013906 [Datura stramonium]|uniref:Uncharacterized protein n=1 Tax=Datura stramonium TaxID=4076 RepID=A0ABS8TM67_DATST|nr:hypothetical protein [Datura stramonium]